MAIKVKISDSTSTTSSEIAASLTAVKAAYDLANGKQDALGYTPVKTVNGTAADNSGNVSLSISAFPTGTKMLFNQSAAPTGWTKQTSVNDATLRVVSGTTGGGTGGSVAFSTLFATGKTVSLSGNVGATTLTVAQMPSHKHNYYLNYNTESNWAANYYGIEENSKKAFRKNGDSNLVLSSGSSSSHTHSLSGTATIALNVKYTDVIICSKN